MAARARRRKQKPAAPARADLGIDAKLVETVLTGFIAGETRRVGRSRVVVGLSGGVDSAVAATLARRALGARGVVAVLMPYRLSDAASARDARALARRLGIRTEERDITPMIDAYFAGEPKAGRVRRGNKMARERMSILYDLSAAHEALVLGTSNKTELMLGYGTIHGDMASSINPLGDLYKTQIFDLARHLRVPASIRRRIPTAGLWAGQTDEKELGATYEDLDQILHRLVDERLGRADLVREGWPAALVDRVLARVRGSQFKRRMPLIAKVSPRTAGIDFRYPRDWGT